MMFLTVFRRHKSHQLRINNFRKILDKALSSKMASMKDEQNTLQQQLELMRSGDDDLHGNLAELHAQQFSSKRGVSPKKGGKRHRKTGSNVLSKKKRSRRNSMSSDDDTSSVDSEVNLVYTKGTKLSRFACSGVSSAKCC